MIRHSLVSHSSTIRATTATGIACTMAMTSASNSSVKPLSARAQGTRYRLDPAALTGDPRYPRVQVCFVLKKVQMAPGLLLGVIGPTIGSAALRTFQPAAPGKIQVDVQPLGGGIEFALPHHPRRLDAQRHLT